MDKRRKQDYEHFKSEVVEAMLEAAGKETRAKIIAKQRYKAVKRELRRPWDGKNGADYEKYRREMLSLNPKETEFRSNSEISDVPGDVGLLLTESDSDSDASVNQDEQENNQADVVDIDNVSDVSSDDLSDMSDEDDAMDEDDSDSEDSNL